VPPAFGTGRAESRGSCRSNETLTNQIFRHGAREYRAWRTSNQSFSVITEKPATFWPHFPTQEGTHCQCVWRDLNQARATGLEPATTGSTVPSNLRFSPRKCMSEDNRVHRNTLNNKISCVATQVVLSNHLVRARRIQRPSLQLRATLKSAVSRRGFEEPLRFGDHAAMAGRCVSWPNEIGSTNNVTPFRSTGMSER
jgi:hypothetical protein